MRFLLLPPFVGFLTIRIGPPFLHVPVPRVSLGLVFLSPPWCLIRCWSASVKTFFRNLWPGALSFRILFPARGCGCASWHMVVTSSLYFHFVVRPCHCDWSVIAGANRPDLYQRGPRTSYSHSGISRSFPQNAWFLRTSSHILLSL